MKKHHYTLIALTTFLAILTLSIISSKPVAGADAEPKNITVYIAFRPDHAEYDGQPHPIIGTIAIRGFEGISNWALYNYRDVVYEGELPSYTKAGINVYQDIDMSKFKNLNPKYNVTFELTTFPEIVIYQAEVDLELTLNSATYEYDGQPKTLYGFTVNNVTTADTCPIPYDVSNYHIRDDVPGLTATEIGEYVYDYDGHMYYENDDKNYHINLTTHPGVLRIVEKLENDNDKEEEKDDENDKNDEKTEENIQIKAPNTGKVLQK